MTDVSKTDLDRLLAFMSDVAALCTDFDDCEDNALMNRLVKLRGRALVWKTQLPEMMPGDAWMPPEVKADGYMCLAEVELQSERFSFTGPSEALLHPIWMNVVWDAEENAWCDPITGTPIPTQIRFLRFRPCPPRRIGA